MTEYPLQLHFHDNAAVVMAGASVSEYAQVMANFIPRTGDYVKFHGINFKTGEPAAFRVVSVVHEFGGTTLQRTQLNLELVVLHQP